MENCIRAAMGEGGSVLEEALRRVSGGQGRLDWFVCMRALCAGGRVVQGFCLGFVGSVTGCCRQQGRIAGQGAVWLAKPHPSAARHVLPRGGGWSFCRIAASRGGHATVTHLLLGHGGLPSGRGSSKSSAHLHRERVCGRCGVPRDKCLPGAEVSRRSMIRMVMLVAVSDLDVGRHVVSLRRGWFVVFGDEAVEPGFEVAGAGVGVFLDDEAGRGVADEDGAEADGGIGAGDDVADLAVKLVEAWPRVWMVSCAWGMGKGSRFGQKHAQRGLSMRPFETSHASAAATFTREPYMPFFTDSAEPLSRD